MNTQQESGSLPVAQILQHILNETANAFLETPESILKKTADATSIATVVFIATDMGISDQEIASFFKEDCAWMERMIDKVSEGAIKQDSRYDTASQASQGAIMSASVDTDGLFDEELSADHVLVPDSLTLRMQDNATLSTDSVPTASSVQTSTTICAAILQKAEKHFAVSADAILVGKSKGEKLMKAKCIAAARRVGVRLKEICTVFGLKHLSAIYPLIKLVDNPESCEDISMILVPGNPQPGQISVVRKPRVSRAPKAVETSTVTIPSATPRSNVVKETRKAGKPSARLSSERHSVKLPTKKEIDSKIYRLAEVAFREFCTVDLFLSNDPGAEVFRAKDVAIFLAAEDEQISSKAIGRVLGLTEEDVFDAIRRISVERKKNPILAKKIGILTTLA